MPLSNAEAALSSSPALRLLSASLNKANTAGDEAIGSLLAGGLALGGAGTSLSVAGGEGGWRAAVDSPGTCSGR
jgi:hypothetical protein